MVRRPPELHPEAVDFEAHAHAETCEAAQVAYSHFFAAEVVVAEAEPEIVFFTKKEFQSKFR